MPELVPQPTYGHDTPPVGEFYRLLEAGLLVTLGQQRAERQQQLDAAAQTFPAVQATQQQLQVADDALTAAQQLLHRREHSPRPHTGIKALRAAVVVERERREIKAALANDASVLHQGHLREASLRDGSARPLHPLQRLTDRVGPARFGVYAFFDYDGQALYVGKTAEGVSSRIRRHLTNQRTDAVAMRVLDPLEVVEVEAWPFWADTYADVALAQHVIAELEHLVSESRSAAGDLLFNEKRIPAVADGRLHELPLPASVRFDVLTAETRAVQGHPDLRIARRAAVAAQLAGRISERSLRGLGLRRSLQRQLRRLGELADQRFQGLGGEENVEVDSGQEE